MPILYQTYVRCQVNLHAEEFTRPTQRPPRRAHNTLFTARSQVLRADPKKETINKLVNTIQRHGRNAAHLTRWELLVEWPELAAHARPRRCSCRSTGCRRQARVARPGPHLAGFTARICSPRTLTPRRRGTGGRTRLEHAGARRFAEVDLPHGHTAAGCYPDQLLLCSLAARLLSDKQRAGGGHHTDASHLRLRAG